MTRSNLFKCVMLKQWLGIYHQSVSHYWISYATGSMGLPRLRQQYLRFEKCDRLTGSSHLSFVWSPLQYRTAYLGHSVGLVHIYPNYLEDGHFWFKML